MSTKYTQCCGLNIKKVSLSELLFNKTMIIALILIAIGIVGWYEILTLRWAHDFVNVRDVIMSAGSSDTQSIAMALKEQIFNLKEIEEVNKAEPWGIFVTQYVYLLYGGSALIFLTALMELFRVNVAPKVAAALMSFGLAMVFGGLISIFTDLANQLNIYWMVLNPQPQSGMWLMMPLYAVYIPFTLIEIYFLITNKRDLARKLAGVLIILGIIIDIIEFYIQGLLFNLNTPRHLWTDIPQLWIYFLITGALTGIGGAILFAFLGLKNKPYFDEFIKVASNIGLITIILAAIYEVINFMVVDPKWINLIIAGSPISWMYWGWIILGIAIPFITFISKNKSLILVGSISLIIGTFLMRQVFIYGGNIVPMTDRFGKGPEATSLYNLAEITPYAYIPPHTMEVLIVIGCLGIGLAVYSLIDSLFDVRNINDNIDH
ncbi:sulfide reductase [Caminibacter mediatlanticus TB-2]|uniref:Sulfide reductase n=1 Tax=Caminibacter mediatlanticus TB-2 TaxID=391592 RepID=A0ABX5VDM1_9BACT|nr:NrfD/PsrC family molybdoenzyme membrane anchor subunit [Caminibacter mediatlanticus]QCT95226.1 sulfide reductase [Caminibacter mediatlanticus TB-2]